MGFQLGTVVPSKMRSYLVQSQDDVPWPSNGRQLVHGKIATERLDAREPDAPLRFCPQFCRAVIQTSCIPSRRTVHQTE
eukprot:2795830-Amphidinium_carterae.2